MNRQSESAPLRTADADRIRTLFLDRPDALNVFNEALYDATAAGTDGRR